MIPSSSWVPAMPWLPGDAPSSVLGDVDPCQPAGLPGVTNAFGRRPAARVPAAADADSRTLAASPAGAAGTYSIAASLRQSAASRVRPVDSYRAMRPS